MNYIKTVDKQLRSLAFPLPFNRFAIVFSNIVMPIVLKTIKPPQCVKHSKVSILGYNHMSVTADVYEPIEHNGNLPCLLYAHGGAFCYTASAISKKNCMNYVRDLGCKVIIPEYHLAPKYRYPAGIEDCLAYYKWILKRHKELGINPERVGVAGDSSGGTYAALLSNLCEQRGLPTPYYQLLTYPALDAEMRGESMKMPINTPIWSAYNNKKMWYKYYTVGKVDLSEISPMHCTLPKVLPRTYIETTEYDCLRDDGIMYAKKLKDAGGYVLLNETKGTFHGYDTKDKADVSKASIQKRYEFMRECFEVS